MTYSFICTADVIELHMTSKTILNTVPTRIKATFEAKLLLSIKLSLCNDPYIGHIKNNLIVAITSSLNCIYFKKNVILTVTAGANVNESVKSLVTSIE